MRYDPNTIAFQAEILHPPLQLRPEQVQAIHNSLYRQREVGYQNFQVAHDGIHLMNVPQTPGSVSAATFLPDRIVVREELRSCTVEEFATRLVNVLGASYQSLGIGTSVAQQFVIRSLITPRHCADSREFLVRRVMSIDPAHWEVFGRPLHTAGIRLAFPQTEKSKETFHVRIESWHLDPRSIWIENTGSFAHPTQTENLPQLGNYLYATYRFLTGPVGDFLARYDTA